VSATDHSYIVEIKTPPYTHWKIYNVFVDLLLAIAFDKQVLGMSDYAALVYVTTCFCKPLELSLFGFINICLNIIVFRALWRIHIANLHYMCIVIHMKIICNSGETWSKQSMGSFDINIFRLNAYILFIWHCYDKTGISCS